MRFLKIITIIIVLISFACLGQCADRETLFQVSTIDALLGGVYDGVINFGQLSKHGDFGIGTLDMLDGEMIALDGRFYQIRSDGSAHLINSKMSTPFAAVTFFDKDKTIQIDRKMTLSDITAMLDSNLGSTNLFYAIRIDGEFTMVKTRSVPKQNKPYSKLVDIVKNQPEFDLSNVRGSIVGFRCPAYVKGVNVVGYHFHFIDSTRTRGGHVLGFQLANGTIYSDATPAFYVLLPVRDDFLQMELGVDQTKAQETVEKGSK